MTTADPLASLAALPGVAEAIDASRAAMDGLLREPALRRQRGEVRAAARLRSAWASAQLAGADVAWEDFEPPFVDDQSGRIANSALQAAGEVGALVDTWKRAPLQALARLHTVSMSGQVPADALGRPRAEAGVSERLTTLADVVTATTAPGVLVAGVVHAELMTLKPFGSADDLVARAASRVVLVSRGVDPDALTVPEMGLLELGADAYRDALDAFAGGSSTGLAQWLTFHAASVQRGAAFARTLCR
ncbi:MAG: oxidoreductase [Actinomycetia bacterium]|nr:oxidoreductase [Actinomycetes bacterium]